MSPELKKGLLFSLEIHRRLQETRDTLAQLNAELQPIASSNNPARAAAALSFMATTSEMITRLDTAFGTHAQRFPLITKKASNETR